MKRMKLTAGIFIMLMITSTMVFSQTAAKSTETTTKTTAVKSDQTKAEKSNATVSTTAHSSQCKEAHQKNFVDSNNDGLCDNCGKKKEECKEACQSKQSNCKSSQSGCSGAQKKSCSHSCGGH